MDCDLNRRGTYLPANQHCMARNQVSVQPYSDLKSIELDDEGRFRLKMCTISAAFFIVNLMTTAIIATCLLWNSATPRVHNVNDEFVQCRRTTTESTSAMTSSVDGKKAGLEEVTCSSLSRSAIKESILEDCDENTGDELRLHLAKADCMKTEDDGSLLNRWMAKLNQSTVTVDEDGGIRVRYSGTYVVHSSLAFVCNDITQPVTEKTVYWQEIRLNNATYFRDAENITRVTVKARPSYCYRSFLYGLVKLTENDRIQVFAGPPELLQCDETKSLFVLSRP